MLDLFPHDLSWRPMISQGDIKLEASGEVSGPPDVGLSDEQRAEVERLAGELGAITGIRTGVILKDLYSVMEAARDGARL